MRQILVQLSNTTAVDKLIAMERLRRHTCARVRLGQTLSRLRCATRLRKKLEFDTSTGVTRNVVFERSQQLPSWILWTIDFLCDFRRHPSSYRLIRRNPDHLAPSFECRRPAFAKGRVPAHIPTSEWRITACAVTLCQDSDIFLEDDNDLPAMALEDGLLCRAEESSLFR